MDRTWAQLDKSLDHKASIAATFFLLLTEVTHFQPPVEAPVLPTFPQEATSPHPGMSLLALHCMLTI